MAIRKTSSREIKDTAIQTIATINPNNAQVAGMSKFPKEEDRHRLDKGVEHEDLWKGKFYEENGERGVFRLKKYFEQDPDKKKILALSVNVVRMIVGKTTRFFVGGEMTFKATTENAEAQKKLQKSVDEIVDRSNLRNLLREEANALQIHGYSTMRVIQEDDTEKSLIEGVSFANTFPVVDFRGRKTQHIIGKYLKKGTGTGEKQFFYAQQYYKEGKEVKIAHKLFTSSGYDVKDEISFKELGAEYADWDGKIETTDKIPDLPIVQVNDLKLGSEDFPTGMVEHIKSAAEEICDCLTRISTQFIKHLSAKIAIPKNALNIEIDDEGNEIVKSTNIEVIPIEDGDPIPQYITNSNPLIEQQFTELEKLLDLIAAAAEIPAKFVGREDNGGAEKVETVKIRMAEFLRKIEDYQEGLEDAVRKLLHFALLLENVKLPEDFYVDVSFREGLPRDKEQEVRTHASAINAGIESKKRAIMEYYGFDEEEAQAELERIAEEDAAAIPMLDLGAQLAA